MRPLGQRHDDGEDHGGSADNGGADEHRLGRGFEGVARAVVGFEQIFGAFEVDGHVEVFLDFGFDVWNLLDQRKFINRLSVVGDRAVGIDRDGDRSHAEEAEGDESEGEDGGSEHGCGRCQAHGAEVIRDRHQQNHRQAEIVAGEVSGDEAGENAERRAAFFRGGNDFLYVARFGGGEGLHQLRNQRAGERSAGDDYGQLPPLRCVAAKIRNDEVRNQEGQGDRNDRGEPDQRGQRRFEIHFVGIAEPALWRWRR